MNFEASQMNIAEQSSRALEGAYVNEVENRVSQTFIENITVSKPTTNYLFIKRGLDIFAALVLVSLMMPVYVIVAVAIKLNSKGPVFFKQTRVGYNQKPFTIYKFRTMYEGVAEKPVKILDLKSKKLRRPNSNEDARVTTVGKFLRTWSLDETPQFINILKGDMSLVGPRPLSIQESYNIPKEAFARYQVPLGLTGLAQIRNRNIIVDSSRFNDDMEYLQKPCLSQDFSILLHTFSKIKQG